MYCDSQDSICIEIRYCDFTVIQCSKHIAHHMSAAEGQESHDKMGFDQSWK